MFAEAITKLDAAPIVALLKAEAAFVARTKKNVPAAQPAAAAAAPASLDNDSALARALHELDESRAEAAALRVQVEELRATLDQSRIVAANAQAEVRALRAQLSKREQSMVVVPSEIDARELEFGAVKEEIGRGAAAAVYAAELRGEKVAVKEMHGKLAAVREAAAQELAIARRLMGHANIVTTFGVVQQADRLCLVMERLPLTLGEALHGSNQKAAIVLTIPQRLAVAHGVAAGLRFCHAQTPAILHRDLKPGNVLLSADLRTVKLCDFGSARALAEAAAMTLGVGTVQYTAPEVLSPPEGGGAAAYDGKIDVFSFGVLLWELFAVAKPYAQLQAAQVVAAVLMRNTRPSPDPASMPEALCALMKRCWATDPQQRPTMAHVVASVGQELQRADAAAQEQAAARNECVICCDAQRSVALVPCGHVCCCSDCAGDVRACPVCRSVVQERVTLFHV